MAGLEWMNLFWTLPFVLPDFSRTEGVARLGTVKDINELQGIYSLSAFSIDLLKRR